MDNLNTHEPGFFYETFLPDRAKAIWDRFEFGYTPKHGSWPNIAEIELNVLIGQCLNWREIEKNMELHVKSCDHKKIVFSLKRFSGSKI